MKHLHNLNEYFQKSRLLFIFSKNIQLFKDICFILAIVLNVLILSYYQMPDPSLDCKKEDEREECQDMTPSIIKLLLNTYKKYIHFSY